MLYTRGIRRARQRRDSNDNVSTTPDSIAILCYYASNTNWPHHVKYSVTNIHPTEHVQEDSIQDMPDVPVWIRKAAFPQVAGPLKLDATAGEHVRRMTSVPPRKAPASCVFVSSAHSRLPTSFLTRHRDVKRSRDSTQPIARNIPNLESSTFLFSSCS